MTSQEQEMSLEQKMETIARTIVLMVITHDDCCELSYSSWGTVVERVTEMVEIVYGLGKQSK